jgi:hypothetical protein
VQAEKPAPKATKAKKAAKPKKTPVKENVKPKKAWGRR